MLTIAERIESTVRDFLAGLPKTRGSVTVHYDDDGSAHLRGAIDTRGYVTKRDRLVGNTIIPKGTHMAGRTIDPLHSAYAYSSQDVTDLRKALADSGVRLSWGDVESLLLEGRATLKHDIVDDMDPKVRRAQIRKAVAKRREWARENGICTMCTTNAVAYRDDGTPYTTCTDCQQRANDARKRRRERANKKKRNGKKK